MLRLGATVLLGIAFSSSGLALPDVDQRCYQQLADEFVLEAEAALGSNRLLPSPGRRALGPSAGTYLLVALLEEMVSQVESQTGELERLMRDIPAVAFAVAYNAWTCDACHINEGRVRQNHLEVAVDLMRRMEPQDAVAITFLRSFDLLVAQLRNGTTLDLRPVTESLEGLVELEGLAERIRVVGNDSSCSPN